MMIHGDKFEWGYMNPSRNVELIQSIFKLKENTYPLLQGDALSKILNATESIVINYEGHVETFLKSEIPLLTGCKSVAFSMVVSRHASLLNVNDITEQIICQYSYDADTVCFFSIADLEPENCRVEIIGI